MQSAEEFVEILAAFDLLGSFHAAADLVGCSHHTVARLVADRVRPTTTCAKQPEGQAIPTALNAASTAAIFRSRSAAGRFRNSVRALDTAKRWLSANCEVRDRRWVSVR